jgi:membrane protein
VFDLIYNTGAGFVADDCFTHAAALAYFAVLSALPLVLIALALTPRVLDLFLPGFDLNTALLDFIQRFLLPEVALWIGSAIPVLLQQTPLLGGVGLAMLLWSASNVFRQIDITINTIWGVYKDAPMLSFGQATKNILYGRLRSLLLILSVGGLFALDNIINLGLFLVRREIVLLPYGESLGVLLMQVIAYLVSLGLGVLAMGVLFRYLPPIRVPWIAVLPGALMAALFNQVLAAIVSSLFTGVFAGVYQAVGGPIALLLWSYFIGQNILLGCELTRHYWLMFCQPATKKGGA